MALVSVMPLPITFERDVPYAGKPLSLQELENAPHLKGLAKAVRDVIHANRALRDIDVQNQQEYAQFIAECSNLVFRLLITKQYYLLSQLFADPDLNAKWATALDEVQQHRQRQQQELVAANLKELKSSFETSYKKLETMFPWTYPDANLPLWDQYLHYESELRRITFEFHVGRAAVYSTAADARMEIVDQMINEINGNVINQLPEEERNPIEQEINEQYQRILQFKGAMDATTRRLLAGGRHNLRAAEEQFSAAEGFYNQVSKTIQRLQVIGEGNERIEQLVDEDRVVVAQVDMDVQDMQVAFDRQVVELNVHKEKARVVAKEEVGRSLESLIHIATQADAKNKEEKINLKTPILNLNQLKESFANATEHHELHDLLTRCTEEIDRIERLIDTSKSIPDNSINTFKSEAKVLRSMVISSLGVTEAQDISVPLEPMNPSPAEISTQNPTALEPEDTINNIPPPFIPPHPYNPELFPATEEAPPFTPLPDHNPELDAPEEEPTPFTPPPAHNPEVDVPDIPRQASFNPDALSSGNLERGRVNLEVVVEPQIKMKESVQAVRENGQHSENKSNEAEIKLLSKVSKKLSMIKNPDDDEQEAIDEAKELIQSFPNSDDKTDVLESISVLIEKLYENHKFLKQDLKSIEVLADDLKSTNPKLS